MYRHTFAEIDLDAITKNIKNTKKLIGEDKKLLAVVKADAYGHGSVRVAKTALAAGAEFLAVALAEEAVPLRESGIVCPILILGASNYAQKELAVKLNIDMAVTDLYEIGELASIAQKMGKKAKIHIKIDSGMGRIGFRTLCELEETLIALKKYKSFIDVDGAFTHFAKADYKDKTFTKRQIEKFVPMVEKIREYGFKPIVHAQNSAAIIDIPQIRFNMCRLGISLYGYYPSDEVQKENIDFAKVMTVKSQIVHIKEINPGESVGYGATFVALKKTKVATIPIGYGDGYNRLLSNKGKVIVFGEKGAALANVIGRVCMDQIMIDITGIDGVENGDEVIIMGSAGNVRFNADDMAEICGTISYEILLDFNARVPRIYKGGIDG